MKEEELDKLFRDALAGKTAPVNESDWAAFEGMLDAGKSGISKWPVLAIIILLLGGGVIGYYFISQSEPQYVQRTERHSSQHIQNEQLVSKNLSEEGAVIKESVTSEAVPKETQERTGQAMITGSSGSIVQSESIDPQQGGTETTSIQSNLSSVNTQSPVKQASTLSNSISPSNIELSDENGSSSDGVRTLPGAGSEEEIVQNDASNPYSYAGSKTISNLALDEEEFRIAAAETGGLDLMKTKGVEAFAPITPILDGNKRPIEMVDQIKFKPFLYFKLEQNNVFKTTPAIGLGWERRISLKGNGAFSLRGGIGYQRTGRLTWERSSQNVVYGFDRYVEEVSLRTNNIGMIQVPLRVGYHIGIHSIFAGAELNWVANASQEYQATAEGEVENGYLYKTGVPETAVFFQLGYGYALNEKMQLDLGFNLSGANWDPADRRPLGGFLRLNYFLR